MMILILSLMLVMSVSFADDLNEASIVINGEEFVLNQPLEFRDGLAYIGLRELYEHLGYTVEWNGEKRTIDVKK